MSEHIWPAWVCDEDVETVWIRRDLAPTASLLTLPTLGVIGGDYVLAEDRDVAMVALTHYPDWPDERGPFLWEAHPDEDGDVVVYRRFEVCELDDLEPHEPRISLLGARA